MKDQKPCGNGRGDSGDTDTPSNSPEPLHGDCVTQVKDWREKLELAISRSQSAMFNQRAAVVDEDLELEPYTRERLQNFAVFLWQFSEEGLVDEAGNGEGDDA